MKINKQVIYGGTGILLLLLTLTVIGLVYASPAPVIIQGEVEATQVCIAAKIFGRIDSLLITEGDKVTRNQLLVSLSSPEIEAKLLQATAAKRVAGAQKTKADLGARKEQIQATYSLWQTAKAQSDFARKTSERISRLYEEGVVSAQKYDEVQAKLEAAKQQTLAAKASYKMAVQGARIEDKEAATALVEKAEGAVIEVKSYLDETALKAPITGEVAEIISSTGELISPGYPIVTIVDLNNAWVTFNLREDLLANVRMGSTLQASIPALGNQKVDLKVNFITALGSYATWTSTKTSGEFDMKTFEVRAIPIATIEGLRPGMSALVEWNL